MGITLASIAGATLKGVGINRWEPLFFDPQKNAIEPFRRIGDNTILATLDQHVSECGNI